MKCSSPVQISSDLSLHSLSYKSFRYFSLESWISNYTIFCQFEKRIEDEKFVEKFGSNGVKTFYLSYSVREKYLKLLKFIQLAFFQLFISIENKHSWKIFDTIIFSSLRLETNFQFLFSKEKDNLRGYVFHTIDWRLIREWENGFKSRMTIDEIKIKIINFYLYRESHCPGRRRRRRKSSHRLYLFHRDEIKEKTGKDKV